MKRKEHHTKVVYFAHLVMLNFLDILACSNLICEYIFAINSSRRKVMI